MDVRRFADDVIKAMYEAWHEGNCDALEKLQDPNTITHNMILNRDIQGWEGTKRVILGWRQAAPDIKTEW